MLPQGVGGCQYLPARLLGGHGGANYWKRGLAAISRSNCLQLAASRLTPPKNRLCRRFCMSWPDARTGTSEERAAAQDTWRLANRSIKFNQVFGVRLSVSMVGSLGHLVDRGVLGRCSCMWRSGLVRTPPCHANWHVSASHNCLGLWHSRITYPQHPLIQVCRFNSRLQSISYRSSTCAHHA